MMSDLTSCLASTDIVIDNLAVPGGTTLDLTKLKSGTCVTFKGTTTFGYSAWNGPLVAVAGANILITGKGTLDGQGREYWDGQGVNGGSTKPLFFDVQLQSSIVQQITLLNSPQHAFNIQCNDTQFINVTVNSKDGDFLGGHNTDGIDIGNSTGVLLQDIIVYGQDDCVAIKSGRDADGRRVNVPSQNLVIQNCTFANGHGGITLGSEMTGGVKNVYARDLTMNSANLQAGHRIKTNTLRGGYARNSNVYRITAGTVGGPLLLIQGNYNGQTGDFPPDITGITLADWTVGTCAGIWSLIGASAADPVGTITLDDLTITTSTAANSAQYVSNLVVKDVTVGGTPVTS